MYAFVCFLDTGGCVEIFVRSDIDYFLQSPFSVKSRGLATLECYICFWHKARMQMSSGNGRKTTLADPVQQGCWTGAYMDVSTACLRCS